MQIRTLTLLFLFIIGWGAEAGPQFHVSPEGDDTNPGTAAEPFRSMVKARDAVRLLKKKPVPPEGGAEVVVHAGTYWFPEPFELGPEDGGAAGAPVIYRAAKGEAVWLNGGLPLKLNQFTPVTDSGTLKRLPGSARGRVFGYRLNPEQAGKIGPPWPDAWFLERQFKSLNELFAGDQRLPLARWPNEKYTTFGQIVEPADQAGKTPEFKYRGHRAERWNAAAGAWLYGYWRRGFRAEFIKVKAIDRQAGTIQLLARNTLGGLQDGGACRYFAVNLLEELDAPGEWFLDRKARRLYFIPQEGSSARSVTLSVNSEAVILCKGAGYVEFRGLGIECSARDGIRIEGGSDCRVVGCEVRNVAFTGVAITGDRHQVLGCDVHDTGNRAIEVRSGDRYRLVRGDAVVDNCHLHHTNRIVRAGSQAVLIRGVGVRFSHNLIHDCGYIAVAFNGNDHLIELNRLFRTNTEAVEGGVFYTGRDWTSRGSIIRYNFVHQVEDSREGCGSATRFVHLDDSAPEVHVYGNVCYRLGGGVSICGGAANDVHDNLFVECQWGVDIGPRGADMFVSDGKGGFRVANMSHAWTSLVKLLKRYHWNQPPYSARYPKLVEIFSQKPVAAPWFNDINRNVMVDCAFGIRKMAMNPDWSSIKNSWEGADPGFVQPDHTKLDFRVRPDAAVCREIGFRPCPWNKIGLYQSPERRTWPVKLDLPPGDWKPRWMRLREQAAKSLGSLPLFKAARVTGHLVIDGKTSAMEWTPGDATGHAPDVHQTLELKWTPGMKEAKRPGDAMVQTDEDALYVQFHVEVNPAMGVTGGRHWGKDDAVEIAIAKVSDKRGPILVLRGYADGTWETTDESGAPKSVLKRLRGGGVRYAAAVVSKGLWTAEWRIPFRALGLDPRMHNPLLLLNLSIRNVGDNEWVMLKRTGGSTWEVDRGCVLWLSQFGEAAAAGVKPSTIQIHILSPARKPDLLKPVRGCEVCSWAKPLGHRLSARMGNLPTDSWAELSFSFVPRVDGEVWLILLGDAYTDPLTKTRQPVWAYVDNVRVEGARLVNGDFEERQKNGVPVVWAPHVKPGLLIRDSKLAASGLYLVKVASDRRFMQKLNVTAGQAVTVRAKVRGLPVQKMQRN